MNIDEYYDGVDHPASHINKFLHSAGTGIFTLMLKDGKITHYSPDDVESFLAWLQAHHISDIRQFTL